jgi:hypothetical protein
MKTLFFILLLAIPVSVLSGINAGTESRHLSDLLSAIQSNQPHMELPDLNDFKIKANSSSFPLSSGYKLFNIKCEGLYECSDESEIALISYLEKVYDKDLGNNNQDWITTSVLSLSKHQNKLGIMTWDLGNAGLISSIKSVAVFDENWNVLYDTELAKYCVGYEFNEDFQTEGTMPDNNSAVTNQASQTKSRLLTVNGIFGSVQLYYEVRATAIVSPYITASTNDAEYNYFTNFIKCERRNPSGIPPNAQPFVYFGTGGDYAVAYQNAVPSTSTISIATSTGDRFNTGLYNIHGANGLNWSFSFDFSVSVPGGGIGITPHSSISALSLSANTNSSISLLNYVYNHNVAIGDVRAVFFDGGSMSADNFKMMTSSVAGETGSISISSKLQVGYMYPQAVTNVLIPYFFNETQTAFSFPVNYLRGDHVLQPEYEMTSSNYNIQPGQVDTLKVKISNRSRAVQLSGGSVSLNTASLSNQLTLISAGTLQIGTIDTSSFKILRFTVMGNTIGTVTPQANISSMGWSSPVPPDILINNIASIDSNIEVGPLTKTLQLTMMMEGFYNPGSNAMNPDTARVYLRNTFSPFSIIDSAKSFLNSSGQGTFSFSRASNNIPYYIQLKHRNSINTWSASGIAFVNSSMAYDFTDSDTKSFGNNMKQVDTSPVRFAIFSGDVNQDETIDATDLSMIDNDAANFIGGYVSTDLTGDNFVDGTDFANADNNASNFISVIRP